MDCLIHLGLTLYCLHHLLSLLFSDKLLPLRLFALPMASKRHAVLFELSVLEELIELPSKQVDVQVVKHFLDFLEGL